MVGYFQVGFIYLNPSFQIRQKIQTNKSLYEFLGPRAVSLIRRHLRGGEISCSFIPEDLFLLALLPTDTVEVVTKFGLVQRCE